MAGNPILDRAEEHWREIAEGCLGSVDIPEWGTEGKPLTVYIYPCNLKTQRIIDESANKDGLEALATVIVERARDSEGKQIFARAERIRLVNRADPDVMSRIVNEINLMDSRRREQSKN